MLSKLLKNDLNKNMRWLWILFVSTIAVAAITRGCNELGRTNAFFQIVGIFFDSIFWSLAVNVVLQPFLRNFLNFTKSFYKGVQILRSEVAQSCATLRDPMDCSLVHSSVLEWVAISFSRGSP